MMRVRAQTPDLSRCCYTQAAFTLANLADEAVRTGCS